MIILPRILPRGAQLLISQTVPLSMALLQYDSVSYDKAHKLLRIVWYIVVTCIL